MIFQEKSFSCYNLLTGQIAMSDFFYFLRHWAICVWKLFVSHIETSYILKLPLSVLSSHFFTRPKIKDKNLNILRTKRVFKVKHKAFSIIFKGFFKTVLHLRVRLFSLSVFGILLHKMFSFDRDYIRAFTWIHCCQSIL